MKRKALNSGSLVRVGYDSETRTLEIMFPGGSVYHYYDVSEATYEKLLVAPSPTDFFTINIRDRYSYKRISD